MLLVEELTHPEQLLVASALKLAEEVHDRQYRKPLKVDPILKIAYITHPMRVALILVEELGQRNAETIAAALLHDVVEDSHGKVTTSTLETQFGRTIALMVSVLTKPPHDKKIPRKQQLATYHERILKANSQTRLIKLCDRLDNMRALLEVEDTDFQKRYLTETTETYLPLAEATNSYLHAELLKVCGQTRELTAP